MWTTIITTIIIAVTTLTGVLFAQWRASVNEDRKRQHERILRNRDYRRQVYVNFITATGSRNATKGAGEASQLVRQLGVALATMRITSTDPVIDTAQRVFDIVRGYFVGIYDGNEMDRYYTVVLEDVSGFREALDTFIAAARRRR